MEEDNSWLRQAWSDLPGSSATPCCPPRAGRCRRSPRIPRQAGIFGPTRRDEYLWLRTEHWHDVLRDVDALESPIRAVIDAENQYTDTMLAPTLPLQAELRGRAGEIEPAAPAAIEVEDGGFLHYARQAGGAPYPTHLRRPLGGGAEQVVLDPSALANGHEFFALHWDSPCRSQDQKLIGWAQDLVGSGQFQVRVREIASGRMLVTNIDQAHGSFSFDPEGNYLFWVGRSPEGHADSVWRRDLRSGKDVKILDQPDNGLFVGVKTTASGAFVVIRLSNGSTSESYLVPASDPTAPPTLVEARTPDLRYTVDHWDDRLLILTDADGAVDMKVMTAPVAAPGRANWRELVSHRPGRLIEALHPFKDRLVRVEWREANPQIVMMQLGAKEQELAFDEPAYALEVPSGQGWEASALAFGYESPRLPRRVQRLILATGALKRAATPATPQFDPSRYVVERFAVPSTDGVTVPVTLLRLRDGAQGPRPLYLYAYGSYGDSQTPTFQPADLALVERGWCFAIAHVRGGAERGNGWWQQVLARGKKRTFEDFIACADYLVAKGYTAPRRIVAEGFSAGGLVIGTAFVQRPELFAGIIGRSPFLDPLGEMDIKDHPLGGTATPFWGDPRVPEDYAYILSYAPYDNLKPANYPALLTLGSLADDRVMYADPLKFAVRARALTTGGNPIMTRIASVGGHVGLPGPAADAERRALYHAFAIWAAEGKWGAVPQR